ncbi:hypothetical protein D9756_005461 [Leucocoprinus leucothites]|uniref:p-hydroxylaminobenzoate lyase n=1 Tax=Leucocoprinus leucothites TaxID=201217 RepID=A0A8H5D9R4_9AGAR|nr:hypothetical protein D9756_005461 [Leucoagaricus leucothites]
MPSSSKFASEVDIEAHPTALKLIEHCIPLLEELLDHTPGPALEAFLNTNYSEDTKFYHGLRELILAGLAEKWLASVALDGARYRRSRLCAPCEATRYFSITAVYMDSGYRPATSDHPEEGNRDDVFDEKTEYSGQFHAHPYGEINAVIALDSTAELKGMSSWQGPGWTSPEPGSKHFPEVRGGRCIALFFLPAGRIAYPADAPEKDGPNAYHKATAWSHNATLREMMGLTGTESSDGQQERAGLN